MADSWRPRAGQSQRPSTTPAGRARDGINTWRGADVINMSLGLTQMASIDTALNWAATAGRGGRGCAVFASSGNSAGRWMSVRLSGLPAGSYTFRWTYRKDSIFSVAPDTAWLDFVIFPGGEAERFESANLPSGSTTGVTRTGQWCRTEFPLITRSPGGTDPVHDLFAPEPLQTANLAGFRSRRPWGPANSCFRCG